MKKSEIVLSALALGCTVEIHKGVTVRLFQKGDKVKTLQGTLEVEAAVLVAQQYAGFWLGADITLQSFLCWCDALDERELSSLAASRAHERKKKQRKKERCEVS